MKDIFACIFFITASLLLSNCSWSPPNEVASIYQDLPEELDFNYHVKPILSDKCFACHGPDKAKQKAGLRLDKSSSATSKLDDSGKIAILPFDPDKSELVKRIFSKDPEIVMPPPDFKVELTLQEKATLTKWIKQGARYKKHWSFIKPESSDPPILHREEEIVTDIDRFILRVLEEKKIKPSPKAEKEILIRRLSFDLRGLPPEESEVDAFLESQDPNAYEDLVDRYLADPAYGERMAADWMDVARYSDTDGYLDDKHRDFSPYRDWVIKAFNSNMSYRDFATRQIAGDLLEDANKETILATAFNRLHKRNSEAGIVFEEFRSEYVADKTLTFGKAFLGLSVECARCHDHKYDPISQKEYYEMSAFFNNTGEIGTAVYGPSQVPGPSLFLSSDKEDQIIQYIDERITSLNTEISKEAKGEETGLSDPSNLNKELEEGVKKSLIAHYSFDILTEGSSNFHKTPNLVNPNEEAIVRDGNSQEGSIGEGVLVKDYTSIVLPNKQGWFDFSDPFSISIALNPPQNFEEVGIFYHCEELRLGLKGYSLYLENNQPKFIISNSWPSNAIQVRADESIPVGKWTTLSITYDGLGRADGLRMFFDGREVDLVIELDHLTKSILFEPDIHTYGFTGFQLGMRDKMKTFLGGGLDELKIYNKELSPLEVFFSENKISPDDQGEAQVSELQALIDLYQIETRESVVKKKNEIRSLVKQRHTLLDSVDEIMVMRDLPEPRPTFILDRGMYDARGDQVFPNTPSTILPFNEDLSKNRLGLSEWLFEKDHPLTARVYVNRIWQMHFGKGLVESSDDFGNQGKLPSHPKLLDYLSLKFIESDWNIKALHKMILMSTTYQQSSKYRKDLALIDPNNDLLARGPSYRMSAEMIRDNALAISGLLSRRIGGKSVYPYQPEGLWDEISNKSWRYKYKEEAGEGLYRRSLYTIWKRTSPPPSMTIFDVGERGICTVKRRQTSTPLQALVLLNDPQYIEACRVLAEQILLSSSEEDRQITVAFKKVLGRLPTAEEENILKDFYRSEQLNFAKKPDDALSYISTGYSAVNQDLDVVDVAALTSFVNGIINTSDAYTIR